MKLSDVQTVTVDAELLKPREVPAFVVWSIGFGPLETRWVCDVVSGPPWTLLARAQEASPIAALAACLDLIK